MPDPHSTLFQAVEKRVCKPVPKCPSKLLQPAIGKSVCSLPIYQWPAEAAYRDILGQSYVHALSAEWNAADRDLTGPPLVGSLPL